MWQRFRNCHWKMWFVQGLGRVLTVGSFACVFSLVAEGRTGGGGGLGGRKMTLRTERGTGPRLKWLRGRARLWGSRGCVRGDGRAEAREAARRTPRR